MVKIEEFGQIKVTFSRIMIRSWMIFRWQFGCFDISQNHESKSQKYIGNVTDHVVKIRKNPPRPGTFVIVVTYIHRSRHFLRFFGLKCELNGGNEVENGNERHQIQVNF